MDKKKDSNSNSNNNNNRIKTRKKDNNNNTKTKTKTDTDTIIEIKNAECQTELGPYDVHFLNSIALEWWKTRKLPVKICVVISTSLLGLGCLFLYSIAC